MTLPSNWRDPSQAGSYNNDSSCLRGYLAGEKGVKSE